MSSESNILIAGGTFNHSTTIINQTNRSSRGMDILMEWVATGAFHNSDEPYDAPKCHPHTRVAVLAEIMKWVCESGSTPDDFMLWLFGPAGAGKSAIAKRIAELAAESDLLIADFFFSRTSPTRRTKDRLIATLAYQFTLSIPETRPYIENAIERDPAIFNKNVQTQIDTLLIKPFQSISSNQIVPSQKLIIIDGLDECNDSRAQVAILVAISRSFPRQNLPIKFLVVSRPETDLVTSFNCNEPLKSIHRRLVLDDKYQPDEDIHRFLSDKFEQIRLTHPLRSTIPISWPSRRTLEILVAKSSGQFIYASTVIKFVESSCHRPSARLDIIVGISPPGKTHPFAELDALYNHLLASVNDIQLTLHVLGLYAVTPNFAFEFHWEADDDFMSPELFLSLEPGDIQLALISLSSILTYDESSGAVKVLHASLVDFLSDKSRSTIFYIDMANACTDFVCRILQYVKGPDGIQAGDVHLFHAVSVIDLRSCIPEGRLRSDILNFDLDAFITASKIRRKYKKHPNDTILPGPGSTTNISNIWMKFLNNVDLDDRDKKEALDQLDRSFESYFQVYQSDRRLQLLPAFAAANILHRDHYGVPYCKSMDILLEMDDHDLHLADQDALNLRHSNIIPTSKLMPRYIDGDSYASGALHCMHFLSDPPKYSKRNECPEMGLIYVEWKKTCDTALQILCNLLRWANTSPELVQFISNHDIHPAVQRKISADSLWKVNVRILAFLSRASVCVYWRIISAILIQRSLDKNDKTPSIFNANDQRLNGSENLETTRYLVQQRLDHCCLDTTHHPKPPARFKYIKFMSHSR